MTTAKIHSEDTAAASDSAAIDWQDLYGRIPDESLIVQFALSFVENTPELFCTLEQSFKAQETAQIESNAHALKGVSANLGAIRLAKAAWQLEKAAREQRKEDFGRLFQSIHGEYVCLMEFLSKDNWIEIVKKGEY